MSTASRIGIKDIARALEVSTGTVDRGLNGKKGISAATRARVLAYAEQVGYTPNLPARFLKSRRPFRISIHLPAHVALFWDAVREGIREAAAPFAPALDLDFHTHASPGDAGLTMIRRVLAESPDGLIVAPGDPSALAPLLEEAATRDIPVVCVGTDPPDGPCLATVCADPFTVGAVAGELLARFVPGRGEIAFFTGWLGTQQHAGRLRGFVSRLSTLNPALRLGPIVEAYEDASEARRRMRDVLEAHPKLKGLYVSTSNSLPVLREAERLGRLTGLTVVATDVFPDLVDWIRAGKVAATVEQRPLGQGHVALRLIYQFLESGQRPPVTQHVVPDIVMASNLDAVLERRFGTAAVRMPER